MYTWINKEEMEGWEANYCGCCKHKWTIEKFIKEYSATGFDFNNIDFNNFAFTLKDMSYIVYKIKMKKFIDLTLKFYSEDRPFGLYDATIEVFQGSYVKRT